MVEGLNDPALKGHAQEIVNAPLGPVRLTEVIRSLNGFVGAEV